MKCENAPKCSIDSVVGIIGNKGNLIIIWHLRTGLLRFTELQNRMCKVNSKTVTKHLRDLEGHDIIRRQVYAEVPPRVEYSLTDRGKTLLPIIEAMLEWGGKYLPDEGSGCPEAAKSAIKKAAAGKTRKTQRA
jgi:DNA-binding HxlR family transcriptional regulator